VLQRGAEVVDRHLIVLSDGIYTVSQVCRILGPKMTPRRVHYWVDTGLISGEPITRGGKGTPTLLSFRQLLEIKTVQHLRDEIKVPLHSVRAAYAWILDNVFERQLPVTFTRGVGGVIIAETPDGENAVIPWGQQAIPANVNELTDEVRAARQAWLDKRLQLKANVVADARVLAGTPTVMGTRIETALVATFAPDDGFDEDVVASVLQTYPHLTQEAVIDALEFEGLHQIA
jgi:uncharacterized protein (DUF433 family)